MNFSFKNIALIGKYNAPEIAKPLLELAGFLSGKGFNVVIDRVTTELLQQFDYPAVDLADMASLVDVAVVMGGDGTLLNIARNLSPHRIPLIGVNQGRLGFLTDLTLDNMFDSLMAMLAGAYVTEKRLLLAGEVWRDGAQVFDGLAFNEVLLHRSNVSRMVEFEVRIDGDYVYNQRADGLIISTPTGSTAYALSAGGPILHPSLEVMELVPICPHTLSNRPIVISGSSTVEVITYHSGSARVRFDSHSNYDLQDQDRIIVKRYAEQVSLLHPLGHSYYHTLREKLLWNQIC